VRLRLRHEVKALQRRLGVTTIMVTHDQEEALTMADRIVVMNHGAIEQVGTPQEIYRKPSTAFVADFVGAMNFLDGSFAAPDRVLVGNVSFTCLPQPGLATGTGVRLCIRPEDVRVRDLPADAANRLTVEVVELDFVGAFCRATLHAGAIALTADFSSNLMRDLAVERGRALDVALPVDRLRVFAA
jgi:iron(III) transport system ATP-binding protein